MTYVTAVEQFVKAYVKEHNKVAVPTIFINKAIALIDLKLDNPCCTDPDGTFDLHTGANNIFTNTITQLLNIMPKAGNVKSLQRTKAFLQKKLGTPCCG